MRRRSTVGGALEMFSLPLPLPLPWNRKITTNWKNWLPKKLFRDHSHSGGSDCPHRPLPYGSATARNRGNVQVIVRKDHRMRLSFLREQLVRSSERHKKGFVRPWCVYNPI